MNDSLDTSEREAEEPRDQSRPQNWDHETATRVFVGGELLPIREMAAEPAPPPVAAGYEPHPVGTGERIRFLERVNAELVKALNSTNKALEAIGDYAHDRSTGPAVWDALWEIRSMAYDNVCTVDAALTSATKEQQK